MLAELLAPEEQENGDQEDLSYNKSKNGPCSCLIRGRDISTSQESSTTVFNETGKIIAGLINFPLLIVPKA